MYLKYEMKHISQDLVRLKYKTVVTTSRTLRKYLTYQLQNTLLYILEIPVTKYVFW